MNKAWDSVACYWDNRMGMYGDWFQRSIIQPSIDEIICQESINSVVDIGCGTGHMARFLELKGITVMGIDISSKMINKAQQYDSGVDYLTADITNNSFENVTSYTKFDCALFNNSMQDIQNVEFALNNPQSLVKADGNIIIVIRHPCFHPKKYDNGWNVEIDGVDKFLGPGLTEFSDTKPNVDSCKIKHFIIDHYFGLADHKRSWDKNITVSSARTLSYYFQLIRNAKLRIVDMIEPIPIFNNDNELLFDMCSRIPWFLILNLKKTT